MLEKIGLPPKPSTRGNNWVVDASHCQGCSSQFTFLNRKHHCRRCGGLFCNSCTQQRMVLRGQGDSPVRICEPCKKLEEAARFELRHGHRSRAGKGSSKLTSRSADEVLNNILANDGKESAHVGSGKETVNEDEDADLLGSASNDVHGATEDTSPEELRRQALDEKNKYKILKGEGKSSEALKAFKRGKELERQAATLELQMRKNRRKALASSNIVESQENEDASSESGQSDKPIIQKGKEKDDLTAELRALGWSDLDIHEGEKKPPTTSLEGELLNLLGHDSPKISSSKASSGVVKTQVVAMKKKALMLKREGKLAEAKEELKKAKILEKQHEEQELLADGDDSDDELSALIRSLDNDKPNDFSRGFELDSGIGLDNLSGYGGDLGIDGNFEVTDDDMHDPEIASALQSLGWAEELNQPDDGEPQSGYVDREALLDKISNLKKEAVSEKRLGNISEAMSLLKKAKNLEKDLENLDAPKASEFSTVDARTDNTVGKTDKRPTPKSRLLIQKELLALKKKALALRREGKLEEADEELKKGKVLEQQLEAMDSAAKTETQMDVGREISGPANKHVDLASDLAPAVEEADVTDRDLHDPMYLSLLENLGWQDEDNVTTMSSAEVTKNKAEAPLEKTDALPASVFTVGKPRRSKAEIQRELLGLKRKSLVLRRQGQETEAEEVLGAAKLLEELLAEIEAPKEEVPADFSERQMDVEASKQENLPEITEPIDKGTSQTPLKRPAEVNDDSEKRQAVDAASREANLSPSVSPDNQKSPVQREILAHKRKALALKREGKLAEAREELRKAKLLDRNSEEYKPQNSAGLTIMEETPLTSTLQEQHDPPPVAVKPMSNHDRFKLQRECLNHKRNALKLRREGRIEEAEAEQELAKKLEAQLEEVSPHDPTESSQVGPAEDSVIEDFLDPQLLSALKAIGLQDAPVVTSTPVKAEVPTSSSIKNESSSQERLQLEERIKIEKVKALNLKRAGKQAEALDALRRAKQMEKKLHLLPS